MFNAPDERYPGEVPVGHFVTRAIAHYLEHARAGQTAADLHDQGSPYGFGLASFLPALGAAPRVAVRHGHAPRLHGGAVRTVRDRSRSSWPTARTTTIAQAKKKYDGLWTDWARRYGGGEIGATVAAKSAQADYDGSVHGVVRPEDGVRPRSPAES